MFDRNHNYLYFLSSTAIISLYCPFFKNNNKIFPFGLGSRIHRLGGSSNVGALENAEYPSLTSLPGPLWSRVMASDRVLFMSQIKLSCVLMLNCIA